MNKGYRKPQRNGVSDRPDNRMMTGGTSVPEQAGMIQAELMTHRGTGLRWRLPALFMAFFLILISLCMFSGCGKADISAYESQEITVTGLKEEAFTVTPAELMEMKCISRQDTGATAKAGTVKAYGPLLSTFLEEYGYKTEDVDRVRFYCKDGYKSVLKDEYLTDYEIILSAASGSEALSEKEQPLRILVPEAESSKWAYGITEIEFVLAS